MDIQGGRASSSRSRRINHGKRRVWSDQEETALIVALKEIVQEGWKCENGFRPGYQIQLEKCIRKVLPQTDIRADPHISSKIHVWKRTHGILQLMLSKSGFSWDDNKKMVIVSCDAVWDDFEKAEPNAKGMRYRSFPLFPQWGDLFGKDRATGENAEDIHQADNDQLEINVNLSEPTAVPMEEPSDGDEIMSPIDLCGSSSASKGTKRKKKDVDVVGDAVVNLIGKFCEQTNERLEGIAQRIGFEFAMSGKRNKLYQALQDLGVLTPDDVLTVAKRLVNNNKDLEFFFSLPEQERARMVLMMIGGKY